MPRKSRLVLSPLNLGSQTIGQRISYLRKQRGLTQKQLAEKIGIIQALVSAYELDKLGLQAEMIVRFAKALEVSTDELLGVKADQSQPDKPSLKLMLRLHKIQSLPITQQKALLKTIDTFIKAEAK